MRKIAIFAATAVLAAASPALAGTSNTQQVAITATQPAMCAINSLDASLTLGAVNAVTAARSFQYTCNFQGQSAVTFVSANGGVKNTTYGNVADYGINLGTGTPGSNPPSGWQKASTLTGSGVTNTGALNVTTGQSSGFLEVSLQAPLTTAGTYNDTLSLTMAF